MLTKTTTETLNQLEAVLQEAEDTQNPLGIFAALHYQILVEVMHGVKAGRFEHPQQIELLEIIVVNRFLEAYTSYQAGRCCTQSWETAFDTCLQKKLVLLQHLFMGINAQVNLDLGVAAAQAAPGNQLYTLEKDLKEFHRLLEGVVVEIQQKLKTLSPLVWLMELSFYVKRRFAQFSLKAASKHAWATAELLSNLSGARSKKAINQIDGYAVKLNNLFLQPSLFNSLIFSLILLFEKQDIHRVISILRK